MRLSRTRLLEVALVVLVTASSALAHGGQFNGPLPNPGRGTGSGSSPRGGGVTSGSAPTWENWWDHNREEFFDVKARRAEKSGGDQGSEGYDADALHQPPTRVEVRNDILPTLVAALRDKSSDVRDAAGIAVGRAGDVPEVEELKPLVTDSVDSVREAGILGLGLLRNNVAEAELIKLLETPNLDFKERSLVALAAGLSGGKRARTALLEKLGAESPIDGAPRIKVRQLEGHRALAIGLIGDTSAIAELMTAYRKATTREANFHPMAMLGMAKLGDPQAATVAIDGLGERNNDVKRSAAILAGRVIQPDNVKQIKALIAHVDDENDLYAKYWAIISLGRIGNKEAVAKLKSLLESSKNRDERSFAAVALGITRDAASAEILRGVLQGEKDVSLRGAAAIGLGILDDKTMAPALLAVLKETGNPELAAHMVTALAMLDHVDALPAIRKLTTEAKNPTLARSGALALALLQDASAIELLVELLRNSGSIAVKGGMATALGRVGDKRAVPPLVKIFADSSATDQTRAFAIVALGLIGDKSDRSDFSRLSIDCNYATQNADALLAAKDIF